MTDVSEFIPVIQKLLERTREGKVDWVEGEGYGNRGFRVVLKHFEFRIFKSEDDDVRIVLRMLDENGNDIFQVIVTDDPVTLREQRQLVSDLKDLYELARRRALNVEKKIAEVADFLDQI